MTAYAICVTVALIGSLIALYRERRHTRRDEVLNYSHSHKPISPDKRRIL